MSTTQPNKRRVAIVGGGNTGLLLAQGLTKNGYQVTVFDKDARADARGRDWTMSVHWSLQHLQKILPDEVVDNLHKAYTDPFYPFDEETKPIPFFNGPTGAVTVHVPAPNIRRLSRTRFRQVCTQGIDVRWSKRLVDIELGKGESQPPVMLKFDDVQNVPDPSKPETWSFNVLRFVQGNTKHTAGDQVVEQLKSMSPICEPFHSAIKWIPEGSKFFATQLDYWVTIPWNNHGGRITLAGDAAHAMPPSRGQGMNHALEDVGRFVDQIMRVDEGVVAWDEAIKAYEEELMERGKQAVERSLEDCLANTRVTRLEDSRLVQQGLRL